MTIQENYSLRQWNTFGMEISARVFAEYESVSELRQLLRQFEGERLMHIGRGSNLLFTQNFDGVVLHSNIRFYELAVQTDTEVLLRVGAGVCFDDFVAYAVNHGWGGAENLSYIPGEVGASAVQNIGAYGAEVKDIIRRVFTLNRQTLEERIFEKAQCGYGYRESVFKNTLKDQYIVTAVEFALQRQPVLNLDYGNLRGALAGKEHPTPRDVREAVIAIRRQKLPEVEETGSAGSFFKNPVISEQQFSALQKDYPQIPHYAATGGVKVPAAWLIEQCGWKGKTQGGAQVYEKQPLVIVNANHATPADIVGLASAIQQSVQQRFGISIMPEVNYI